MKSAIHRATDTEVAIKVFDKKDMKSTDLDAARNEYRALKHISHPNVLGYIDHFESPAYLVIVLPRMMSSFSTYLEKRKTKLSEEETRNIFKMIVAGAEHCH